MALAGKQESAFEHMFPHVHMVLHTFMFDMNTLTAPVTAVLKKTGQRQAVAFTFTVTVASISITCLPCLIKPLFKFTSGKYGKISNVLL